MKTTGGWPEGNPQRHVVSRYWPREVKADQSIADLYEEAGYINTFVSFDFSAVASAIPWSERMGLLDTPRFQEVAISRPQLGRSEKELGVERMDMYERYLEAYLRYKLTPKRRYHRRGGLERAQAALANWLRIRDLKALRVSHGSGHPSAEEARFTYNGVRRTARYVFLGVAISQFIYVITGVTVLHPVAAVTIAAVAISFYVMSSLMRKELFQ